MWDSVRARHSTRAGAASSAPAACRGPALATAPLQTGSLPPPPASPGKVPLLAKALLERGRYILSNLRGEGPLENQTWGLLTKVPQTFV